MKEMISATDAEKQDLEWRTLNWRSGPPCRGMVVSAGTFDKTRQPKTLIDELVDEEIKTTAPSERAFGREYYERD